MGRLCRHDHLTLLGDDYLSKGAPPIGGPLYIPETQEPAPLTEDAVEEQANLLQELGASSEGSVLRAKLQSASLLSDMEAFKAANPTAALVDFIRWHSPRDWIVDDHEREPPSPASSTSSSATSTGGAGGGGGGSGSGRGRLSDRMMQKGNIWLECWAAAKAVPVRRQKRLFDETREAEKVLHWFDQLTVGDACRQLLPCILQMICERLLAYFGNMASASGQPAEGSQSLRSVDYWLQFKKDFGSMVDRTVALSILPRDANFKQIADDFSLALRNLQMGIYAQESLIEKLKAEPSESLTEFLAELLSHPEVEINRSNEEKRRQQSKRRPTDSDSFGRAILRVLADSLETPMAREYIFRTHDSYRNCSARRLPQRLYCCIYPGSVRMFGAFSSDLLFS